MTMTMKKRRGWTIRGTLILALFLLCLPSSTSSEVPDTETERVAVDHITREHHEQLLHDAVASAEKSLQDQSQSLQSRLDASEMRETSFIYKVRESESLLEAQAKKSESLLEAQAKKSEGIVRRIQTLEEQRKQLSEDLKTRTQELAVAKNKYFDTRQDLYAANVRLRELERRANESIFLSVWSRVSSSKEVGRVLQHAEQAWGLIKDSAIDPIQMKLGSGLHMIKSQRSGLLSNWNSFLGGVAELVIPSKYLRPLRQYRHQMISTSNESLQNASSVIISYCMLQQKHEPSGWLHFASQYANANSGFVVGCLEVLLILLCLGTVLYIGFLLRSLLLQTRRLQRKARAKQ
jgi:hypothetical protein